MYLRGSKWSMNKRRKPWNWFRIILLGVLVAGAVYVNQFIVPNVQPIGIPTPTPTRDPEFFVSEAEQLFADGKLSQAIDAYTEVVRARPRDSASYIAMARVQVWARRYADAKTSAENAILINPNNSNAHAVRGWALDFQKDYVGATSSIKKALEIDPNNALAHAYYAELLMDRSENNAGPLDAVQQASDELKKAVELDPSLLEAHRARGYVHYLTNHNDLAISEYQYAIGLNKNLEDLYLSLGLCYRVIEANDDAINAFTQALTLNPSDPLPNLYISLIEAKLGNFAPALQYAQQALQAEPSNANYHGNLGVMLYRNFEYEKAIAEFKLMEDGGTLTDGTVIAPLDLTAPRASQYYYIYAVTLTKMTPPQCGEAVKLALILLDKLRTDQTATFYGNDIVQTCAGDSGPTETPAAPGSAKTPTVTPTP